ncbi:acylphosphatase-1 isoform X1 [Engystomops pustulosus]|uniref:acylphosphatase-1 isoform X1 n=1 Tax=Engystomops pustulosus TaxID=76066 RepID=UPI003AFA588E
MIQALSEDVKCRLRSGVTITSVAQCVEELLLNSVDAKATCVAVRVDLETFKVQVVDNGCGLCRTDMEHVGMRYFTSKCHSVEDLENLRFYGFRGEAIASMVNVANVVEICSKLKDTSQTFIRLYRNGKSMEVVEAESPRPSAGTTVTLYNLFSNLPVRKKCLNPVLELERIRQRVEAVALVKPSISFSLRNYAVHAVVLQLPKTKDPCSRFCQIYGLSKSQSLREVQNTIGAFTMHGLISCEGHYNRTMQFLYVNNRLVLKTKLHKLIDFIIRKESSICRSGRSRSAADLYGIFIVNIQCHVSEYDICFQPDKTLIEFQDWDKVMQCTEQALRGFLKREKLFLEPSKDDIADFSQKHHYNLLCEESDQSLAHQDPNEEVYTSDPTYLRSKCVYRSSDIPEMGSPPLGGNNADYQLSKDSKSGFLPTDTCDTYSTCVKEANKVNDMLEEVEINDANLLALPENSKIQMVGMVSSSLFCAGPLSEKNIGSVHENPVNSKNPKDESMPKQPNTCRPADYGGILKVENMAQYSMSNKRQKLWTTKKSSREKQRGDAEPTLIRLSTATSLGGTLDRFRRLYGTIFQAPQLPKSSETSGTSLNHKIPGQGSTATVCVDLHQRESIPSESIATLTTKLCRLKNKMEEDSREEECNVIKSTVPVSSICDDGTVQSSSGQQEELTQNDHTSVNIPDQPMCNEWLQYYEESLGKNVFINTATGLSSYSAPTSDKTAACTKDLSNMAVNVVCNNGFQYKCHPFKSQALIPFLPRPRDERDSAKETDNGVLSSLYGEWKNPVYVRHPGLAVDVSQEHSDALSVKIHNILYPYRFTKEMVHSMRVLQQVDNKFVACLMNSETRQTASSDGHLLVLVDQHAAHERVRLEQLIADSFEASSEACEKQLRVSVVDPPIEVCVSEEEYRVLRTQAGSLRRVGLSLLFSDTGTPTVSVREIPMCFVEREANEIHRGRTPVVKKIVEEYLREQVQILQVPGAGCGAVPGTVLKVLASQACHGAVKFNQSLTLDECCYLMQSLAQCSLPFQCAHGRPSILPLADLHHMVPEPEVSPTPNLKRLRRRYRAWQLYEAGQP